jgi:hypothetical protein
MVPTNSVAVRESGRIRSAQHSAHIAQHRYTALMSPNTALTLLRPLGPWYTLLVFLIQTVGRHFWNATFLMGGPTAYTQALDSVGRVLGHFWKMERVVTTDISDGPGFVG